MSNKTVTLISPFFAPDESGIALYNAETMNYLVRCGYDVQVLTGVPFYPEWVIKEPYVKGPLYVKEQHQNLTLYRFKQYVPSTPTFSKRLYQIFHFTVGVFFLLFRVPKSDVVFVVIPYTTSLTLGVLLKWFHGSKLWCHVQDFEIDAATESFKSNWIKILFSLERVLFNSCHVVSTISHQMMKKLSEKTSTNRIFFPNFINPDFFINPPSQKHKYFTDAPQPHLLYSGNIGEKQDWTFFLEFCKNAHSFEIVIVGDGAKRKWLEDSCKLFKNVSFYDPVPFEDLPHLLASCDIHFLFQKEDVIDSVMPSKLLGMMLSEKPSVLKGNKYSESRNIIESAQGGLYYTNVTAHQLVLELEQLATKKNHLKKLGTNAKQYILKHFDQDIILRHFENKMHQLANKS